MKNRSWLKILLFVFLAPSIAFSQNYLPLKTNGNYFFQIPTYLKTTKAIKAYRIDSTKITGNRKVFYDQLAYRDTYDTTGCYNHFSLPLKETKGPSWLGKELTNKKSSGRFYTLNAQNDTVNIRYSAQQGDTFLLYKGKAGKKINGIVQSHDTLSFLGLTDSVKTIVLQPLDSLGNTDSSSAMAGRKILLSKNFGMVKTLNFLNFPSDTSELTIAGIPNPRRGVHILTLGEVYDYDVGDEWIVIREFLNMGRRNYQYSKVLKKYYSSNMDTVYYEMYGKSETATLSSGGMQISNVSKGVSTVHYTNLNQKVTNYLPNESSWGKSSWTFRNNTMAKRNCEGYEHIDITIEETVGWGPCPVDSNKLTIFEADGGDISYYEGLGTLSSYYYNTTGGTSYRDFWGFYKKGNDTCGSHSMPDAIKELGINESTVQIYPNPASNKITVSGLSGSPGDIKGYLFDSRGKMLKQFIIREGFKTLSISQLPNGIYFFQFHTSEGILSRKKLVVQH